MSNRKADFKSRVYLNLGEGDGKDAVVTRCVRENGEDCEGTKTPSERSFHTDYGKGAELYPESLTMTGGGCGVLGLSDLAGLRMAGTGGLRVTAAHSIRLKGKNISIHAVGAILAGRTGAEYYAVCIQGDFDLKWTRVRLKGTVYQKNDPFEDKPVVGFFDWGRLVCNLVAGLAIAACLVVFSVAAAGIIATMLAWAAAGAAIASVSIAVSDYNSGNVRSEGEAVAETLVAAAGMALLGACSFACEAMGLGALPTGSLMGLTNVKVGMWNRGVEALWQENLTFAGWWQTVHDPGAMLWDFTSMFGLTLIFKGFQKLRMPKVNGGGGLDAELLDELARSGVKYNPDDIVAITKTVDGKLVWLENGTENAGLNHIIAEHADDFLNKGITQEELPNYIMSALENGKIVGYQGRGAGRPIYEFIYKGVIHKIAITVGDNGFIVGANPK